MVSYIPYIENNLDENFFPMPIHNCPKNSHDSLETQNFKKHTDTHRHKFEAKKKTMNKISKQGL